MRERHSFVLCDIAVVDGTGGPAREHAFLEVLGSRIARIGDMADYAPHDGVEEIRLPGHYVMPGLIDAHVHLSGGRAEVDDQEIGVVAEPMGLKAMRSVYEAQRLLKRGFTTVRDISWNGFYLQRLFFEQQIPGPKVVVCGPGLTRTGGHCAARLGRRDSRDRSKPLQARADSAGLRCRARSGSGGRAGRRGTGAN